MSSSPSVFSEVIPTQHCLVCLKGEVTKQVARDHMYDRPERFIYSACLQCGSMTLDDAENASLHYPDDYYSLRNDTDRRFILVNVALRLLLNLRIIGQTALRFAPNLSPIFFLSKYRISRAARILDVGSGAGRFVRRLAHLGYNDPVGVDPFIAKDIAFRNGGGVRKAQIADISGLFDVIFFNHSLEHIANPSVALQEAKARLAPNGYIVVRIPLSRSYTSELFKECWYQLDAPRHRTLFSDLGFKESAARAGVMVVEVIFDSIDASLGASLRIAFKSRPHSQHSLKEFDQALKSARPALRKIGSTLNSIECADQAMYVLQAKTET